MVATHHISPVSTSLGKWEIQGRNKLWRSNLERKWQTGNGKWGFGSVIMSDAMFGLNRKLVWSSEGRQKLAAGRSKGKLKQVSQCPASPVLARASPFSSLLIHPSGSFLWLSQANSCKQRKLPRLPSLWIAHSKFSSLPFLTGGTVGHTG